LGKIGAKIKQKKIQYTIVANCGYSYGKRRKDERDVGRGR
jgi:hypothetical protein